MKKKILVYNGYYLPAKNYGGPTSSLVSIINNCSDEFDFYVVAANHDMNDNSVFENITGGWNQVGKAKVLYLDLAETYYSVKKNKKIISSISPDLVWLVGILVPSDKWFIAKACRDLHIPYLISPRGELCENAMKLKRTKKKAILSLARLLNIYKDAWYHATSDEEKEGIIKFCKVDSNRIFLASNIAKNLSGKKKISSKEKGSIRIVFISRIHEKKNLLSAIKIVKRIRGKVTFDIYGPIESSIYWEECSEELKSVPDNVKIKYCGYVNSDQVQDTFNDYDCFLFPTLSENYGHVIAEALSSCCPVVLSKGTTPWDDINNKAGFTCELNDIDVFVEAVQLIADMDCNEYQSLLNSTYNYYVSKIADDNAVLKHKEMLRIVTD